MRPLNTDSRPVPDLSSGKNAPSSREGLFAWMLPNRAFRKIKALMQSGSRSRPILIFCAVAVVSMAGFSVLKFNNPDTSFASSTALSSFGFPVRSLIVNGNSEVDEQGVEFALTPQLQGSMFSFDTGQARETLLQNPWFKSALVRKVYPGTISVDVVERQPFAFWKASDVITVIARDGTVLGEASQKHLIFPQVVGQGANLVASEFISVVSRFPEIGNRSSGFVRVAQRRWDVVLRNGLKVQLPEEGWQNALAELDSMHKRQGILDREIVQIDMRLPDRLVLRLEEEAAQERRERLEKVLQRNWHRT